jgi:hypothetical protein
MQIFSQLFNLFFEEKRGAEMSTKKQAPGGACYAFLPDALMNFRCNAILEYLFR